MCVVSMIMDHYSDKWGRLPSPLKPICPWIMPDQPYVTPYKQTPISQDEINEFRKLLERAREYDKRNNEPDCELESKKRKVKELAESLGIGDKVDFL